MMIKFHSFYKKIVNSFSNYFIVDSRESLLKKVNVSLLIFEDEIINLETGKSHKIESGGSPENILSAAKKIISKSIKKPSIALFLPSNEFISTSYQLPEVNKHDILSALKYQQESLLPVCRQSLLVSALHDELSTNNIALWFPKKRADTLFDCFAQQNINISALFPASMLFSHTNEHKYNIFCEQGEKYFLISQYNQQQLKNWDFFYRNDLQQKEFKQQFQKQWDHQYPEIDFSSIDIINSTEKFLQITSKYLPKKEYGFYPEKAEALIQQESRFRKGRFVSILLIIPLFILSIPFITNALEYKKVQQEYAAKILQSEQVRTAREMVLNYEDSWAVFDNYPQNNMTQTLLKINSLIPKSSWLSSFELKKGIIEIEGYSSNPSEILELLSQQDEFEKIAFNQNIRSERGKNKEHFGITFHLINIDEDSYYKEFFQ